MKEGGEKKSCRSLEARARTAPGSPLELSERQATNARILLKEIERRRHEAREQDRNFIALDAAQLLDRLQRANTPFISSFGRNGSTTSPGAITVDLSVLNPDPVFQGGLFVHLFIGLTDIAITLLDERFPRLTEPEFFGLKRRRNCDQMGPGTPTRARAWSTFGPHAIGTERSVAVSSGASWCSSQVGSCEYEAGAGP